MCRLVYYIEKSNIDTCLESIRDLMTIQKCESIEIQYIDKFQELGNCIQRDFSNIGEYGFFSLQMITQGLTMPKQMSIHYIRKPYRGHDEAEIRQYEQMLKEFIFLSDYDKRFSMLRKVEADINNDENIYQRSSKLEEYFKICYGYDIPKSIEELITIAVLAMEKKWNDKSQVMRRNLIGINEEHFYQVIWFSKEKTTFFEKTDIQMLMNFNRNMVTYQSALQGEYLVKYDIREFYAIDREGLNILVQAHKNDKISDESLILHVMEDAIADCLSLKLIAKEPVLSQGNSISKGAACGKVIFGNESLEELKQKNEHYILVKNDLTPIDIEYIYLSDGIITGKCSSTSHQAIIARQLGKVFVFACQNLEIEKNVIHINGIQLSHDTKLSIDGETGYIYYGEKELKENCSSREILNYFTDICYHYKNIGILANTESFENIKKLKDSWFEGIGLYRTEYMYPQHTIKRLLQKSVLATNYEVRIRMIKTLQSIWEKELFKVFDAVENKEIVVRTLDYPSQELFFDLLHELPDIATDIQTTLEKVEYSLSEVMEENGMLGNRGSRFSISYPELFEAQIYSIFQAYSMLEKDKKPDLKLMFPMISHLSELQWMKEKVEKVVMQTSQYQNIDYKLGIMLETPRAVLIIEKLAKLVDFMSFGTNDLTQLIWGMSREDHFKIINKYKQSNLINYNPYERLDEEAMIPFMEYAIKKAKEVNPKVEIGICGEQAFNSEKLLYNMGIDYISINPDDIPYAILLAAQTSIMRGDKNDAGKKI